MTNPKCYSYIRFSSMEQSKGDSQRRQTEAAEEWAKKHGQVLDDSLRPDLGLSAYSGAHRAKGALGKFLEKVREGRIVPGSILLVENLDRLSREQALDALGLFTDIIKAGIKIVTLADGMEFTTDIINANPMSLMMSLVTLTRGHEESKTKSLRLKSAWGKKRANLGERKLTARAPAWLKLTDDKKTFYPIPERAAIVRRIFEMKLSGLGSESIAKALNQEKETWNQKGFDGPLDGPRKGGNLPNGWRKSYIEKILNSRATIGEFTPHKFVKVKPVEDEKHKKKVKPDEDEMKVRQPAGESIPDYFPAVVSQELFHAVQDRLEKNKGKGGKNGAISNLFGHIAKCGYCASPMQFISKGQGPKGGQYLLCDNARRGNGCNRYSIKYPDFEKLILTYCKGLTVSDLLPDGDQVKTDIDSARQRLSAIQGENAAIQSKITNLGDSIADSPDKRVRERLQANMAALMDKADALAEQEKATDKELSQLSTASHDTQERLDSLNELLIFMDSETQENVSIVRMRLREKLRGLIARIDIHPVGQKRMTLERVEELIQAVLDVQPLTGTEELERLRTELTGKINNKEYGQCSIHFSGGSRRTILMGKNKLLALDFDREAGQLINCWIEDGVERSKTYYAESPTIKH